MHAPDIVIRKIAGLRGVVFTEGAVCIVSLHFTALNELLVEVAAQFEAMGLEA